MILDWLRKVFKIKSKEPTPKRQGEGDNSISKPLHNRFNEQKEIETEEKQQRLLGEEEIAPVETGGVLKDLFNQLDQKKRFAGEEKKQIKLSSTDWYNISVSKTEKRERIGIYRAYSFGEILNLKTLKEERLKKEARELKILEDKIKSQLRIVEKEIRQRHADGAVKTLTMIAENISKVRDGAIRQKYKQLQINSSNLVAELEREKLARLAEEKHRKEEEIRKQREAEEQRRKEKEKQERAERKRREAEVQRVADEAKRKVQAEQQERQQLLAMSSKLKENWQSFKQILDENGVTYLYHFTDSRNIPSIKRHGGLFSWHYCHTHGIKIPCQGGDYDSQELDKKYGLEDYVRLSFCDDHPMMHRLRQSGSDIKLLKIKIDVAFLENTQFSDINAADKLHTHGKTLDYLKMVDFDATKMHYVSKDSPNFKPHQAEVMVKTFVPLKYIVNI